jgi:hypothetical protein
MPSMGNAEGQADGCAAQATGSPTADVYGGIGKETEDILQVRLSFGHFRPPYVAAPAVASSQAVRTHRVLPTAARATARKRLRANQEV